MHAYIVAKNLVKAPMQYLPLNKNNNLVYKSKAQLHSLFKKNYQLAYDYLSISDQTDNTIIKDCKNSLKAILDDRSFRHEIEQYIEMNVTLVDALMAFYENEIMPYYPERISVELLGLLRLIYDPKSAHVIIEKPVILLAENISICHWFTLNIENILGVVLVNNSIHSHASQIIKSLGIPLALLDESEPIDVIANNNDIVVTIDPNQKYVMFD
jgi:signal transduction protein with GAF and PtsI domain